MNQRIINSASKVKNRKKIARITKIILLIIILLLIVLYFVMGIVYNGGNFSISLDRNLYLANNIIIYDDPNYKVFRTELYAKTIDYFDNISHKWLPEDLATYEGYGSHNGDNYVAYTFFVENQGEVVATYWSEVIIEDVIKQVDEAVRLRVYRNGEEVTYAKMSKSGIPEKNTTPFKSDDVIALTKVSDFKPGDIDKYTVVIWIEGSDPESTDNILGGEIKIRMDFNSEIIEK